MTSMCTSFGEECKSKQVFLDTFKLLSSLITSIIVKTGRGVTLSEFKEVSQKLNVNISLDENVTFYFFTFSKNMLC